MNDPRVSFISSVTGSDADTIIRLIGTTTIRIHVSPNVANTFAGQVLTFQLATLTARLFDRVELAGDETAMTQQGVPLESGPYLANLRRLLPTLRPVAPIEGDSGIVDVVVGEDRNATGSIFLGSSGWTGSVSRSEPAPVFDSMNPVGPLVAGTFGASEVFKIVFRGLLRGALESASYSLSLLNYGAVDGSDVGLPERVNLDAVLFGCGSIGCGFLQAVRCTPQLCGDLIAVDNGRFEIKNTFKYSMLDQKSAEQGMLKAVWAQRRFSQANCNRISVLGFHGTAESFVSSQPHDYKIPLAISAVDTVEARFEIQDTIPKRIVNAGIDGSSVEVSMHGFGDGPCLACLGMEATLESWDARPIADKIGLRPERVYELIRRNDPLSKEDVAEMRARNLLPELTLAVIDQFVGQPLLSFWNNHVAYGEAAVTTSGGASARVTTAFVSAFAGVLLLAELLKDCIPELQIYRVDNSYRQDLLGVPAGGLFKHEREKRGWCLCHSTYRLALHREKYALLGS